MNTQYNAIVIFINISACPYSQKRRNCLPIDDRNKRGEFRCHYWTHVEIMKSDTYNCIGVISRCGLCTYNCHVESHAGIDHSDDISLFHIIVEIYKKSTHTQYMVY